MNILTMNKNVFGSSFTTTRRKSITEKAINSELIIPESAVDLSYEEMEYIDGSAWMTSHWWGQTIHLSGNDVTNVTTYISLWGFAVGSAASLVPGVPGWASVLVGALAFVNGAKFTNQMHVNGAEIKVTWAHYSALVASGFNVGLVSTLGLWPKAK